jgi:hypothetical protein
MLAAVTVTQRSIPTTKLVPGVRHSIVVAACQDAVAQFAELASSQVPRLTVAEGWWKPKLKPVSVIVFPPVSTTLGTMCCVTTGESKVKIAWPNDPAPVPITPLTVIPTCVLPPRYDAAAHVTVVPDVHEKVL